MNRIIFFGTSSFAIPVLEALHALEEAEIVAVVTKPDEPQGREKKLTPTPVRARAQALGLRVLTPERVKEVAETLRTLQPDVGVVAAYGKILPKSILEIPAHGYLNIHPSLLPRWRGPSPLQAAIASGDRETGVTVIKIDEEMDHGPIVAQERAALRGDEWYEDLKKQLAQIGARLIASELSDYLGGFTKEAPQDHAQATFCKELTREDGRIHWHEETAEQIERKLRAYSPWPGIWTEWRRGEKTIRLKIIQAAVARGFIPRTPSTPGEVQDPALHVRCRDGFLQITSLHPEGGKSMTAAQLVNGYRDVVGSVFA